MQRDQLERFIMDNREEFDEGLPGLKVWAQISRELERRQSRRFNFRRFSRAAAAALLLLASGAGIGHYFSGWRQEASVDLASISPELAEMERYFNDQYNRQYQILAGYQYDRAVDEELEELGQIMDELKQELLRVPKGSEEKIISDLIRTYQTRTRILERVLESLQPGGNTGEFSKTVDDEISI
jgi:hypothetical protein